MIKSIAILFIIVFLASCSSTDYIATSDVVIYRSRQIAGRSASIADRKGIKVVNSNEKSFSDLTSTINTGIATGGMVIGYGIQAGVDKAAQSASVKMAKEKTARHAAEQATIQHATEQSTALKMAELHTSP